MDKCCKCKTPSKDGFIYHQEFGDTYQFCKFCDLILGKKGRTGIIKGNFLNDDHGDIQMSQVERNILDARIDRSKGKSKW